MAVVAPIWLNVLDETSRLCQAHGRADLIEWLRQKRAQLLDSQLRVLVVGEPKQGKSQLINALINAQVCPVGDGVTTTLPTIVKHADEASTITHPTHVEIGVPRGLLASGMVLIDTPGIDNQDPARLKAPPADVVLLVSDATRELSVTELNLLLHLAQSHAHLAVVLTKIDISPHWRLIADHNRQQLAGVGVAATVIPVSSALRLAAATTNDQTINAESGFPVLLSRLMRDHSAKGDELARASVNLIVRSVVDQLAAPLRQELSIEDSPARSDTMSRLRDAQRAVDELRRCSTSWQNTLNDEMADLISDLEYDLRDRTRRILREVDELFDEADPLTHWESFSGWLDENLIEAAEANYRWLVQRCEAATRRVADHFVDYGYGYDALPRWSMRVPDDLAERVSIIEQPRIERFTPSQKIFSGLRGSYGGILMFGLATSLVGMPLINPVSIGAGALFGGKTVLDDSKSALKRRQTVAKQACQRHIDDFFLRFSKDCRDTARQVQRMLRDHFTALTEQLQEAIIQSFRRAKQAADLERNQRHRQIEQRLRQLASVYEQAQALVAARVTA
ncbi:dynamin family protein [Allorhizocola rhizosphaerae]|uniref:dynamin family protein n=1 Tax=Allorhizocola rhizosphaerae TaxID=1872709 RepID=UPI000E3CD5F2|nr:dynamin family protein [Allorhizocola rhizosphaerae]